MLPGLASAICCAAGQMYFPNESQKTGNHDALSKNAGASRLNDFVAYRVAYYLTHVMQVELAHYIGAMRLDCFNTET